MKPNIGALIDELAVHQAAVRKAEQALRLVKTDYHSVEVRVMAYMDKEGLDSAKGKKFTASKRDREFVSIVNRRKLNRFAYEHNMMDIFQGRVSMDAYRSLSEDGVKLPGVKKFKKTFVTISKRRA